MRRLASRPPLGIRLLFALTVLLGLATAPFWLWSLRVDPSRLPQDYLHEVGTTSARVRMHPLPTQHLVIISPVETADLGPLIAGNLPRPLGRASAAQVQGYYDTATRTIHVTGPIVRLSASAPIRAMRGLFVRALRHEYGHAFLDDWLRSRSGNTFDVAEFSLMTQEGMRPGVPEPLRPVVEEYRLQPADVYGSAYPTSNFNEFFAESYARFLSGKWVPPEMERFLAQGAEPKRAR